MYFSVSHSPATGLNSVVRRVCGALTPELGCNFKLFCFSWFFSYWKPFLLTAFGWLSKTFSSFTWLRLQIVRIDTIKVKAHACPIEPLTPHSQTCAVHDSNTLDTFFLQLSVLWSSDWGSDRIVLFVGDFRMCVWYVSILSFFIRRKRFYFIYFVQEKTFILRKQREKV